MTISSFRDPHVSDIIKRLQKLGAGPLCDADKGHRQTSSTSDDPDVKKYKGLNLMDTDVMKLRHAPEKSGVMIGIARTLQLGRPNDFLAVLVGLGQLSAGDVLVVNTGGSTRAVAGSLFTTEATRRGVSGIVVDGPIRDVNELDCFAYSTKVTPYAGTVQHIGEGVDASSVQCAGVTVNPGDIVFGDADGILVGSVDTFSTLLHDAEHIVAAEQRLIEGMKVGVPLHSMMNFDEHFAARKEGRESSLTVCSKSKQRGQRNVITIIFYSLSLNILACFISVQRFAHSQIHRNRFRQSLVMRDHLAHQRPMKGTLSLFSASAGKGN